MGIPRTPGKKQDREPYERADRRKVIPVHELHSTNPKNSKISSHGKDYIQTKNAVKIGVELAALNIEVSFEGETLKRGL